MCNLVWSFIDVAPPRLLFSVYSTLVRRVNIDGQNLVTIYSATYPRALDFDYQWVLLYSCDYNNMVIFIKRLEYVFWVDFSNDRIIRARGIETPSSYQTLVSSGITCAGMWKHRNVCAVSIHNGYFDFDTDGLAWDWVGGNLYWTDYCQHDIEVYNPLSGYRSVIINSGLIEPHTIVADPTTRWVKFQCLV